MSLTLVPPREPGPGGDVPPALAPKAPSLWAVVVLAEHDVVIWPEGLVVLRPAIRMTDASSTILLRRWSAWRASAGDVPAGRRTTHHLARLVPVDTDDGEAWLVDQLGRLRP